MTGKTIGYVRVSSTDQNTARQLDGIELDKEFVDHCSGKDTKRPQLALALDYLRDGDTLLVHSMDRLARNVDDLRRIVKTLTGDKVAVRFVKENLVFMGDDSPMSNLLLTLLGAVAEFERAMIRERQREGIKLAQQRGVYKGRKRVFSTALAAEAAAKVAEGVPKARVARDMGITRGTLYNYLNAIKEKAPPAMHQEEKHGQR